MILGLFAPLKSHYSILRADLFIEANRIAHLAYSRLGWRDQRHISHWFRPHSLRILVSPVSSYLTSLYNVYSVNDQNQRSTSTRECDDKFHVRMGCSLSKHVPYPYHVYIKIHKNALAFAYFRIYMAIYSVCLYNK